MSNRNLLEIIEYISIGASVTGTIIALITKQFVFAASPLVITFALNGFNRHRQNQEFRKLQSYTDYNKLVESYQDIIAVNDDYRFHKLEVTQEIDKLSQNYSLISSRLSSLESEHFSLKEVNNNLQKLTINQNELESIQNQSKDLQVEINNLSAKYNLILARLSTLESHLTQPTNKVKERQEIIKTQQRESDNRVSILKPFSKNEKWGYKDSNGNVVIKPIFDYAWDFLGEFAKVKKESWGNYKYGLINTQGDIILPIEYYSIESFCEGMARVTQESWGNYKYGFINNQGNLVIPTEYDYAESFKNGLAKVKKENSSFYIDKKGNTIINEKNKLLGP